MREIGGYLEFEHNHGGLFHEGAIGLNSARNCLAYLIEAKDVKRLHLPKFLCDSVRSVCEKREVEICFYPVGKDLKPKIDHINPSEYVYYVNYYGQTTNQEILELKKRYPHLVVDNVQAYFQKPVPGVDTVYSCRKFIGVPDGGFLYTDALLERKLEQDQSYDRTEHVFGRLEKSASEFYASFRYGEEKLARTPLRRMSALTENILRGVDYEEVKLKRERNFLLLDRMLNGLNRLSLHVPEGPYMYPLYLETGAEIRKRLQQKKIYIATLWPNVFEVCEPDESEYDMAENILPLPVDQRYGLEDLKYMVEEILKCIA